MLVGMYIKWQKEYRLGIPILDEQNRGLVSIINTFFFHSRYEYSDLSSVLVSTAEMFKGYVKIYLYTIERLMKITDYPDQEKYKAIHEKFIKQIEFNDIKLRSHLDAQGLLKFIKEHWFDTLKTNSTDYIIHFRKYIEEHSR